MVDIIQKIYACKHVTVKQSFQTRTTVDSDVLITIIPISKKWRSNTVNALLIAWWTKVMSQHQLDASMMILLKEI